MVALIHKVVGSGNTRPGTSFNYMQVKIDKGKAMDLDARNLTDMQAYIAFLDANNWLCGRDASSPPDGKTRGTP